jgi:hypothetical protein
MHLHMPQRAQNDAGDASGAGAPALAPERQQYKINHTLTHPNVNHPNLSIQPPQRVRNDASDVGAPALAPERQQYKTQVVPRSLAPVFEETFVFHDVDCDGDFLTLEMRDFDAPKSGGGSGGRGGGGGVGGGGGGGNDRLGTLRVPFSELVRSSHRNRDGSVRLVHQLFPLANTPQGEVEISGEISGKEIIVAHTYACMHAHTNSHVVLTFYLI